jgi:hypothetical protein
LKKHDNIDLARFTPKWRSLRETLQYVFEEFAKLAPTLPKPLGGVILDCARRGLRKGQGKGRSFLSTEDKLARESALKEFPELRRRYFAEAKASGTHLHPREWASVKAAEDVQRLMRESGMRSPWSISAIRKKWKSRP